MATYIIRIHLQLAGPDSYRILANSMQKENFIPADAAPGHEKAFSYYGNQNMLFVNEAVQRAAASTGKSFSFTIIKDKRTERQYHINGVSS